MTTKSSKVDDAVWVNIYLKKMVPVRTIRVYQTSRNFFLKQVKVKHSLDGVVWESAGTSRMDTSYMGALGAVFSVSFNARYIRIEASEKGAYYWGLGEVEVFTKTINPEPTVYALQVKGQQQIKVTWSVPRGGNRVIILRKKHDGNHGSQFHYPVTRADGPIVLDSKAQTGTFVDKDVQKGERYYYMAFAHDPVLGWSAISYKAGDNTVCFAPNPNLAQDQYVRSNLDGNSVIYGAAHYVVCRRTLNNI